MHDERATPPATHQPPTPSASADEPAQDGADAGRPDEAGRVRYGGGYQHGGGMIEPQEFADGGTDVLDDADDDVSTGSPGDADPR